MRFRFFAALTLILLVSSPRPASAITCDWKKVAGQVVRYFTRQTTPSENGVPIEWHHDRNPDRRIQLDLPEGKKLKDVSIPELFLRQARRDPDRVLLIDALKGPITNRDIVAGIYFLKPRIEALGPETNIGVMLPATVGASITTLATQFAGKTPTMLNFTVGNLNLRSAIETAKLEKILTSREVLAKFPDLKEFESKFVFLEDLRTQPGGKAGFAYAVAKSRLTRWHDLDNVKVAKHSVILFTSGSSGTPKGVPLTHFNQLANIKDILEVVPLREDDRIIGILPPFHSFGATGNVVLPLVTGAKIAYYPNPLAGKSVADAVEKYHGTVILGTPTFLQLMARGAKPGQLDTLRAGIVGAEPTTEAAAHAIAEKTNKNFLLLNAYGTTEAAPAVTVNDPKHPLLSSIGIPLPSMKVMVANENEHGVLVPVKPGEMGRFLIRGPNVFEGYLNYDGPSPFVKVKGNWWYDTGDLVTQDPKTKAIDLKGRANMDFVKIGGEMISFQAIVNVLNAKFAVADANRFVVSADKRGERPRLVLLTAGEPVDMNEINDAITGAGLTNLYTIARIIPLKEFPLLGTGKLDRKALQDRAQED